MMCPACCLSSSVSCVVSRLACLPLTHPLRSSASPLAPPCVSCLCSPACLVSPARLVSSAHHVCSHFTCLLFSSFSPSLVSSVGASSSRSHLVMCSACRPASRPPSGYDCGCPRLVSAFRCPRAASASSCSLAPPTRVGERGDVGRWVGSGAFLCDFCAVGCFSRRSCAIMYAVAMGTSE